MDGDVSREITPAPGGGVERGSGELLLALLAGSALAPFVQAIATKAGQDVYDRIRDLLRKRGSQPVPGAPITLTDREKAVVLELPATLSTTEASGLAAVRVPPSRAEGWLLVRYDPASSRWTTTDVVEPPPGAIDAAGVSGQPRD